jgi:hypothetical protein
MSQTSFRLSAFRAQEFTLMKRTQTMEDLSDQQESFAAAEMLMKFQMETTSMHRALSEFTSHAQEAVKRRSEAVIALSQQLKSISSSGSTCASSKQLKEIGQKIAFVDLAESNRLASLTRALSASADSMTRIVSFVVDGGLLLHSVRMAPVLVRQRPGESSQLLDVVGQLDHELKEGQVGELLAKVSQGFLMSRQLLNLFSSSKVEAPQNEQQMLDSAWSKLGSAAHELRQSLESPSSQTYRELLLKATKTKASSLSSAFPSPSQCGQSEMALWQLDAKETAWLITGDGKFLACNTATKALEAREYSELVPSLSSFLDNLHGW